MFSCEIDRYSLYCHVGPGYDYQIMLYNEKGLFCRVYFDPAVEAFEVTEHTPGELYIGRIHSTHYLAYVDLLRNEKPVYFEYQSGRFWISTSSEPVGELDPD